MIDIFSLAISHGLMLLIAWRLVFRPDLDDDSADLGVRKSDFLGRPIVENGKEQAPDA